jgi:hypothetical protein
MALPQTLVADPTRPAQRQSSGELSPHCLASHHATAGCEAQLAHVAAAQTWPFAHDMHVSPSLPHRRKSPPPAHVPPSQHPWGQLCGVQTQMPAPLHGAPAGHALQSAPPVPQVAFVFGSQVPGLPGPLEQQSFGQLCAVHRHAVPSPLQTVPGGQRFSHVPPQPSGPQTLPAQERVQHVPWSVLQTQLRKFGQSPS